MDRLWSPWRMEYIESHANELEDGRRLRLLRAARAREIPTASGILRRGETRLRRPSRSTRTTRGTCWSCRSRHTGDVEDLTAEEGAEIHALLQRSVRALREESEPHGFNVGLNLGRVAGAGIPEHLHWHVVPRWGGDTNFMPVVGETRVLPQLLCRRPTSGCGRTSPHERGAQERGATIEVEGGHLSLEVAGDGPGVVLLHPGLWDSRTWDDQFGAVRRTATACAVRRARLRAVEPPDGEPYSHVRDLAAVMDAAGARARGARGLLDGRRDRDRRHARDARSV